MRLIKNEIFWCAVLSVVFFLCIYLPSSGKIKLSNANFWIAILFGAFFIFCILYTLSNFASWLRNYFKRRRNKKQPEAKAKIVSNKKVFSVLDKMSWVHSSNIRKIGIYLSLLMLALIPLSRYKGDNSVEIENAKANTIFIDHKINLEDEYLKLPEDKINLAKGSLIITKGLYPDIDIQKYLDQIDAMAEELKRELKGQDDLSVRLYIFTKYPYEKLHLTTERETRYLNFVIDKRQANCVGASLLYLSLAERIELPLYGVHSPEHMFVRYDDNRKKVNIDQGNNHPDNYYIESWIYKNNRTKRNRIAKVSITNGVYLRNLTKKEVLAIVLNSRGLAWIVKGQYDKALSDYNKAIKLNPKDFNAYINRGNVWHEKGQYDKALADYNKAIKLDPKDFTAYINRGNVWFWSFKKDDDKALSDYNKAIKLEPKNSDAYLSRALVWKSKQKYDKALADFNKAIKLDPKNSDAYLSRGRFWSFKKDYDKALSDCNKAIKLGSKDSHAYGKRGVVLFLKKDYNKALSDFNKACIFRSNRPPIPEHCGHLFQIKAAT